MKPHRHHSLFISCPCYGRIEPEFVRSVIDAVTVFTEAGIPVGWALKGEPEIAKLRNTLGTMFLDSAATDYLFLDVDQKWDAKDVVRWLRTEWLMIVSAPIALKQRIPALACVPAEPRVVQEGYVQAAQVGTGMLLVRRKVMDAVASASTEYVNAVGGPKQKDLHGTVMWRNPGEILRLGEDVSFWSRARGLGFEAWIDPRAKVTHYGVLDFEVSAEQREELTKVGGR